MHEVVCYLKKNTFFFRDEIIEVSWLFISFGKQILLSEAQIVQTTCKTGGPSPLYWKCTLLYFKEK